MITEKDLRIPFTWEERRPIWLNRLFYIPAVLDYEKAPISWVETFGNANDVMVEYCSGNGQWITDRAKQNPHLNWVAVEKRFERARNIWLKIHRHSIPNLIVICGEALAFTRFFCPLKSVKEIFINFPDPWPKQRHAKHRLIKKDFLSELLQILQDRGKAMCVTDDPGYAALMVAAFKALPEWHCLYQAHEWPDYGPSYFSELWKAKGRTIHYLSYEVRA